MQISDILNTSAVSVRHSGARNRNNLVFKPFPALMLYRMGSAAPSENIRLQALLSACLDISFGTLWWIREDLWKERQQGYDQESDRLGHPGLSIRRAPPAGLFELVPMLHGSFNCGPVAVSGLTRLKPLKTSYFGQLLFPAQIPVFEFARPASDADSDELTGPWYRRARTSPNWEKLRITPGEADALEQWEATISSTRKNSFNQDFSSS